MDGERRASAARTTPGSPASSERASSVGRELRDEPGHPADAPGQAASPPQATQAISPNSQFLDEEILELSGRRISIKRLPSGDITFKAFRFDVEVVSLIRSVAKVNHGKYQPAYKSWLIPRWRAPIAREHLRTVINENSIGVIKRSMNNETDQ